MTYFSLCFCLLFILKTVFRFILWNNVKKCTMIPFCFHLIWKIYHNVISLSCSFPLVLLEAYIVVTNHVPPTHQQVDVLSVGSDCKHVELLWKGLLLSVPAQPACMASGKGQGGTVHPSQGKLVDEWPSSPSLRWNNSSSQEPYLSTEVMCKLYTSYGLYSPVSFLNSPIGASCTPPPDNLCSNTLTVCFWENLTPDKLLPGMVMTFSPVFDTSYIPPSICLVPWLVGPQQIAPSPEDASARRSATFSFGYFLVAKLTSRTPWGFGLLLHLCIWMKCHITELGICIPSI